MEPHVVYHGVGECSLSLMVLAHCTQEPAENRRTEANRRPSAAPSGRRASTLLSLDSRTASSFVPLNHLQRSGHVAMQPMALSWLDTWPQTSVLTCIRSCVGHAPLLRRLPLVHRLPSGPRGVPMHDSDTRIATSMTVAPPCQSYPTPASHHFRTLLCTVC